MFVIKSIFDSLAAEVNRQYSFTLARNNFKCYRIRPLDLFSPPYAGSPNVDSAALEEVNGAAEIAQPGLSIPDIYK